jgi:aminodeoxyfutalosine synthase
MACGSVESRLHDIRHKVESGERLSFDDGVFLYDSTDIFTLGELANIVRERKNGNFAYYNVNTHMNPTNVCVYRCTFCAFRADLKNPKGYVMTDEEILERAAEADQRGATEVHIVGGLHHQLPYEWYLHVVKIIHDAYPELHLKAYTAVEWDWFSRLTGRPTRAILAEFKEAGLGSLPGGPDGPTDDGRQPAHAGQLSAHQGLLGDARHQDRSGLLKFRRR